MKRIAALTIALLAALCFTFGAAFAEPIEPDVRSHAGSVVSGFAAPCIEGGTITGAAFGGYSLSIVVYWATWSGDALAQIDHLAAVHAARPDIGVFGLLHVDATSTAEAALAYMQEKGYSFPVFTADAVWSGVLAQGSYLPESFFVSPGGVILEAYSGVFASASSMIEEAGRWIGPAGTFTVRFFDRIHNSCTLLASYTGLSAGASVSAPAVPQHPGYAFTGWSSSGYNSVTGNLDVFTVYDSSSPDGDADQNGVTDPQDALLLLRVVMGLAPSSSAIIQHGDMDQNGLITANDVLVLMRSLLFGDL